VLSTGTAGKTEKAKARRMYRNFTVEIRNVEGLEDLP